jgi:glycine cleavage system aminomethyltransferase T
MPNLADDLRQAGATMMLRGSRSVVAHHGSVSAELSVCRTHVGIADRSDLDVLEFSGHPRWFATELARRLGAEPAPGGAVRVGGAWCGMVDPGRAIVAGPPAACHRLAGHGSSPLRCADLTSVTTAITLLGPRVAALLANAGLPTDLATEGVRACWLAAGPAVLLRERPERYLLIAPIASASEVWHELLVAGRPLELSCVGVEALDRLAAAAGGGP